MKKQIYILCISLFCVGFEVAAQGDTSLPDTNLTVPDSAKKETAPPQKGKVLKPKKVKKPEPGKVSDHSPRKALKLALILPGSGQFYNKKYWKMPLVYGGIAACTYFFIENRSQYVRYSDAYRLEVDDNPDTQSEFADQNITPQGIAQRRDQYKQWMELSIIGIGVTYMLQVVDAYVDAHLFDFDVSDDLSMRWQPDFRPGLGMQSTIGFKLSLNLKK